MVVKGEDGGERLIDRNLSKKFIDVIILTQS